MKQPQFWAAFKSFARRLMPSRAARWSLLYVPAFTLPLLLVLKTLGTVDDLVAYVLEAGARSVPVLIGIALTYGLASGLGWNLDNHDRANLQRVLVAGGKNARGAFLVLAGEMVSILALLLLILRSLLVWQG